MKTKCEKLQEIFSQYINGNKKDTAYLVDEYGLFSVWDDLHGYLLTLYAARAADEYIRKMVISYHYIKYR